MSKLSQRYDIVVNVQVWRLLVCRHAEQQGCNCVLFVLGLFWRGRPAHAPPAGPLALTWVQGWAAGQLGCVQQASAYPTERPVLRLPTVRLNLPSRQTDAPPTAGPACPHAACLRLVLLRHACCERKHAGCLLQGDEPLIEPEIIDEVVRALQEAPDAVYRWAHFAGRMGLLTAGPLSWLGAVGGCAALADVLQGSAVVDHCMPSLQGQRVSGTATCILGPAMPSRAPTLWPRPASPVLPALPAPQHSMHAAGAQRGAAAAASQVHHRCVMGLQPGGLRLLGARGMVAPVGAPTLEQPPTPCTAALWPSLLHNNLSALHPQLCALPAFTALWTTADQHGYAIYFSRGMVPHNKDGVVRWGMGWLWGWVGGGEVCM